MGKLDSQIIKLFRQLDPGRKKAALRTAEIMVDAMNGLTECPAAQTERERELLRLVRESADPSAALRVAMDIIEAYTSSGEDAGMDVPKLDTRKERETDA